VGPRGGLDGCGKSRPTAIRSTGHPDRSESLYGLHYPGRHTHILRFAITQCGRGLSMGLPFGIQRINKDIRKFSLNDIFRFLELAVSSGTVVLNPTYTRSALFRNRAK